LDKSYDYKELQQYWPNITQYSVLPHEQIWDLIKTHRQGDQEAVHQVINSNIKFVVKVRQRYFKRGLGKLELIQQKKLGLPVRHLSCLISKYLERMEGGYLQGSKRMMN
jgi:DNA-directed RNA polymerase sigma subunit (sigma70/sigma32)